MPPHFDLGDAGRGSHDGGNDCNVKTSSGLQDLGPSIEVCEGGNMTTGFRHKAIDVAYNVPRMALFGTWREDVCAQVFCNAAR